jgi:hypothetical protein
MIVIFYTNQSGDFFNRHPLTFSFAKNNGAALYAGEAQSVLYLGAKDGHSMYRVYLGTGRNTTDTDDTFFVATVDKSTDTVLDVSQVHAVYDQLHASASHSASFTVEVQNTSGGKRIYNVTNGQWELVENVNASAISEDEPYWVCVTCALMGLAVCALECGAICYATAGWGCWLCGPICNGTFILVCAACG